MFKVTIELDTISNTPNLEYVVHKYVYRHGGIELFFNDDVTILYSWHVIHNITIERIKTDKSDTDERTRTAISF